MVRLDPLTSVNVTLAPGCIILAVAVTPAIFTVAVGLCIAFRSYIQAVIVAIPTPDAAINPRETIAPTKTASPVMDPVKLPGLNMLAVAVDVPVMVPAIC